MAATGKVGLSSFGKILTKQKINIVQDLDITHAMSVLWSMFSRTEELEITSAPDPTAKSEIFLDTLARKSTQCFQDFCSYLEKNLPHLLTKLLLESLACANATSESDSQPGSVSSATSLPPTQSLQLSLELALKERDAVLREKAKALEERDEALLRLQALKEMPQTPELDTPLHPTSPAPMSPALSIPGAVSRENGLKDATYSTWPADKVGVLESQTTAEGNERATWETRRVILQKSPTCGFGIAISGGRDNPHFSKADPAIAVSDVIKGGPAEGKLLTNDRVLSVNGLSLENVEHSYAISVLREGGNAADLIIRRKLAPSSAGPAADSATSTKVTLAKKNRRDDFGIVIGQKLYVKDIRAGSLAAQSGTIKEGDVILKINDVSTDALSLSETRKLIEKSGRGVSDKLHLLLQPIVAPAIARYSSTSSLHKRQNSDLDHHRALGGGSYQKENVYAASAAAVPAALQKTDYERARTKVYSSAAVLGSGAAAQQQTLRGGSAFGPQVENVPSELPARHHHHQQAYSTAPGTALAIKSNLYSVSRQVELAADNGEYRRAGDSSGLMPSHLEPVHAAAALVDDVYVRAADVSSNIAKPRNDHLQGDIHYVSFKKDGSIGIRVAGGNSTGIFISAVQDGSSAHTEGLREGDEIVKVDGRPVTGMTREEVVSTLLAAMEQVDLAVRPRDSTDKYERFVASARNECNGSGDLFYIRTHFAYDEAIATASGHIPFAIGDVFRVSDTLVNGEVGEWFVERLHCSDGNIEAAADCSVVASGIIPNATRAVSMAAAAAGGGGDAAAVNEKDAANKGGIGGFFRRRSSRRTKSLSKDHWDDVVFVDADESSSNTKFSAYERVELQKLRFIRPVVIFGSLSDVARDKLCREYPELYESPQPLASATAAAASESQSSAPASSGIIHLATIRNVMARGRHCVLDVTPGAVDRLCFAQYAPIVVLLHVESKTAIKELRERWAQGSRKSARKLYDQAARVESACAHLLSATLNVQPGDGGVWFQRLQAVIAQQQQRAVWMSAETQQSRNGVAGGAAGGASATVGNQLAEGGTEDILFPMSNRLSFVASPGSDLDLTRSSIYYDDAQDFRAGGSSEGHLGRSNSDPNLASRSLPVAGTLTAGGQLSHPEDRYYPSYYAKELPSPANSKDPQYHDGVAGQQQQQHSVTYGQQAGLRNQEDWSHARADELIRGAHNLQRLARMDDLGLPSEHAGAATELYSRPNPPFLSRAPSNVVHGATQKHILDHDLSRLNVDEYSAGYDAYGNKHDDFKIYDKAEQKAPQYAAKNDPYRFTRLTAGSVYSRPAPVKPVSAGTLSASAGAAAVEAPRRTSTYMSGHYEPVGKTGWSEPPDEPTAMLSLSVPDDQKMNSQYRTRVNVGSGARDVASAGRPFGSPRQQPQRSASMSVSPAAYPRDGAAAGEHHRPAAGGLTPQQTRGPASANQSAPWSASNSPRIRGNNGLAPRTTASLRSGSTLAQDSAGDSPASYANMLYMDHREAVQSMANGAAGGRSDDFEAYKKLVTPGHYDGGERLRSDALGAAQRRDGSGAASPGSAFESYHKASAIGSNTLRLSDPRSENDSPQQPQRTIAYVKGLFDDRGGLLESKETGVSIRIPPGALPAGVKQEVYFRVCEQDRALLSPLQERGETILSPLVMCGPEGLEFLKPVQLCLPHVASGGLDNWALSLNAAEVGGRGGESDWHAVAVDGRTQTSNVTLASAANSGKNNVLTVQVDHF